MPLLWSWEKSISFHLFQLIICSIPQILQFPSPPFLPAGRHGGGGGWTRFKKKPFPRKRMARYNISFNYSISLPYRRRIIAAAAIRIIWIVLFVIIGNTNQRKK
jgi:hypothetical protein